MVRSLLALAAVSLAYAAEPMPPVVAIVNGQEIAAVVLERRIAQSRSMSPDRFDAMPPEQVRKATSRLLHALVLQELEYQEATKQKIAVSDAEVNSLFSREKGRFPTVREFDDYLAGGNTTVDEWKQQTRRVLLISRLEEQVAAAAPEKWVEHRRAWLQELVEKARIWCWEP